MSNSKDPKDQVPHLAEQTDEPQAKQQKPARSKWRRFAFAILITIKWIFIAGLLSALCAGGAVYGYVTAVVKDDPIRSKQLIQEKMMENAVTGFVYFNDDTVIGQLRTEEDRRLVQWKDIPAQLIDALTSIEDKDFFEHPGISVNGTARAVKQKLLHEENQTGGSTVTQQLARRVFLSLDKTEDRKLKEIFLSLRLERYMSKQEILVAYLNKVPFGNGSSGYNLYGIKAAAKGIFNIDDLHQLNLAQSAYLVGLPQLPSTYSAFNGKGDFDAEGFNKAVNRMQRVLTEMRQDAKITEQQYSQAMSFDIKKSLAPQVKKAYATYPYLMLEAERQAAKQLLLLQDPKLTPEEINKSEYADEIEDARVHLLRGGYKVYTTIDKSLYDGMREIAANPKNFTGDSKTKGVEQTAAVMLNNKDGAILGMIEGRSFELEQMNYATQMIRQPGSTMKPIAAYLPAIEKGSIQPASVIDDAPIIMKDYQKGFHIPQNWNHKYQGLVTARKALNESLNLPALKLFLYDVGIKNAWEFARSVGITTLTEEDNDHQTGVIGGLSYGVTVEELTNAYSAIANKGEFTDAYMIRKIEDAYGKVIFQHQTTPIRVVSEQSAFLMTDMLHTVITDPKGTGVSMKRDFKHYGKIPIVGKTGSTQNYGDVWFMGYSPDITLGVWAGYERQKNTLTKEGRNRAKKIWAKVMDMAVEKKPELFPTKDFKQPDGIIRMTVSDVSGKLPTALVKQTNHLVTDLFNRKNIPTAEDDVLVNERFITYNGINYIAQKGTPEDFIQEKMVVKREKPIQELLDEIESAQSKMPEDSRKPLETFRPLDSGNDAPTTLDPRKDEGRAPTPPSSLNLTRPAGTVKIAFGPSGSGDVVGYRLYRAVNGGSFGRMSGKVVFTGDELKFVDYISGKNNYEYYVTAVDVAGNESVPSSNVSIGSSPQTPVEPEQEPADPDSTSPLGITNAEEEQTVPVPATPQGLNVSRSGAGIHLEWIANPSDQDITSYHIYYSAASGGSYELLDTVRDAQYDYIAPSLTGYYRVTAVNNRGESEPSDHVSYQE
ncbi:transglycosylase domain-containing protein [Paenibacillus gansuensis]|uniref:Transglycosylase domain-containing protein n=1 Tax=Paenibacillus gansuensis TaxID=306542 RepID=A0ABW5PD94_9BACL